MSLASMLFARAAAAPAAPGSLDLLNALRDIHEPPAPGFWPPAPGWWLLAALLVAALSALIVHLRRRQQRARPVRAALAELDRWVADARSGGEPATHAERLAALLRRVALLRYPRHEIAALTGEAWLRFLDRTGSSDTFSVGPGRVLGDDRYAPSMTLDVDTLAAISRRWLEEHLQGANVETGMKVGAGSRAANSASSHGAGQTLGAPAQRGQPEPSVHAKQPAERFAPPPDSGAAAAAAATARTDQRAGDGDGDDATALRDAGR